MKTKDKSSAKPSTKRELRPSERDAESTIKRANAELRRRQQDRLEIMTNELTSLLGEEASAKWQFGQRVDEELSVYGREEQTRLRLDPKARRLPDERHEQARVAEIALRVNRDVRTISNWRYFFRVLPDFSQYDPRLHYMHYVHLYSVRDALKATQQRRLLRRAAEEGISTRDFVALIKQETANHGVKSSTFDASFPPQAATSATVKSTDTPGHPGWELVDDTQLRTELNNVTRRHLLLLRRLNRNSSKMPALRAEDLELQVEVLNEIDALVNATTSTLGNHVLDAA
jgi:hypothetical protein